jgi:hypothetical protein
MLLILKAGDPSRPEARFSGKHVPERKNGQEEV